MVNTPIDRVSYNIGAGITLFNGFKNTYRLKQSKQLYIGQKEQIEQSIQDVILQVSQQFLQILLDKELLIIAEKDFEIQQALYEQIETYVKVGIRASSELLTQEAQLKSSEVNLVNKKNQLRSNKANLAKTLLFEPFEEFDIISPQWKLDNVLIKDYQPDSLLIIALNNRPEIQQLQAKVQATLQEMKIAKSNYSPKLNFYFSYGSNFASNNNRKFSEQLFNENWKQYGFNLNIPIFNNFQNHTNVIRSKVIHENLKLKYFDSKIQLLLDIQNAYQDFLSYKKNYFAYKTSAEAANKAYERKNELYRLGQGNLIELNIENQRNIKAESERIQAKYRLVFQQVVIDYYTGVLMMMKFN